MRNSGACWYLQKDVVVFWKCPSTAPMLPIHLLDFGTSRWKFYCEATPSVERTVVLVRGSALHHELDAIGRKPGAAGHDRRAGHRDIDAVYDENGSPGNEMKPFCFERIGGRRRDAGRLPAIVL